MPLSRLFLGSLYYHIFLEDSIQLSLTQTIDNMPCTTDFQKRTISCDYDLLPRTIISLLRFHSPFHSSKVMFIHCTLLTLIAVFQVVPIPLPVKYYGYIFIHISSLMLTMSISIKYPSVIIFRMRIAVQCFSDITIHNLLTPYLSLINIKEWQFLFSRSKLFERRILIMCIAKQ